MSKSWKSGRWLSWFTILLSLVQDAMTTKDAVGCHYTPENIFLHSGQVKMVGRCREIECQVVTGGIEILIEKRCPSSVEPIFVTCDKEEKDVTFPKCCFTLCKNEDNFKSASAKITEQEKNPKQSKDVKNAHVIPSHHLLDQEISYIISRDLSKINKQVTERNRRFTQPKAEESTTVKPSFYLPIKRKKQTKKDSIAPNAYIPKLKKSIFSRKQNKETDISKENVESESNFDSKKVIVDNTDQEENSKSTTYKSKDIKTKSRAADSSSIRKAKSNVFLRRKQKHKADLPPKGKDIHDAKKRSGSLRRLRPIRRFNSRLLAQETRSNSTHEADIDESKPKKSSTAVSPKRKRTRKLPITRRRTNLRRSKSKLSNKLMLPIANYELKKEASSSSIKPVTSPIDSKGLDFSIESKDGKESSKLPKKTPKKKHSKASKSKPSKNDHLDPPKKTRQRSGSHFDRSRHWVKEISRSYNSNWSSKTPEKMNKKSMYRYIAKDSGNSPTDYKPESQSSEVQVTKSLAGQTQKNKEPSIKENKIKEEKISVRQTPSLKDQAETDQKQEGRIEFEGSNEEYTHEIPDFEEYFSSIAEEYKEYKPLIDLSHSSTDEEITHTASEHPNEPHTTITFRSSRKSFVTQESSKSASNSGDDPHYQTQTHFEVIKFP